MSSTDNGSSPQHFKFNLHLDSLKGEFEVLVEEIESLRKERDEYKARVEVLVEELQDVRRNFFCERCRTGTMSALHQSSQADVPSQHSRSGFCQSPDAISSHSQTVTLPSPSSQPPTSDSEAEEGNWPTTSTNEFEDGKELDLEIVYVLSHGDRLWCVKFSQDGKFLATGCRNGKAYIYDVQTGTLTYVLRNLLAEHDSIRAVCFSRDGKYLATSSSDAYIYIWEIRTKYVRNAFKGHTDFICSLDFSQNGQLLVSASYDNTVRLWNVRYGAWKVLTDEDHCFLNYDYYKSAKFSPDGKWVAASHYDGTVRMWDVRLGRLMRRLTAHVDLVNDIAFMPDGKGLVSGGRDMTLNYWHVGSLVGASSPPTNELHRHLSGVEEVTRPERQFLGHEDSIYSLAISPDGRLVASGSDDQSVCIWDTRTARVECILDWITNDGNGEVNSVDFSPAGRYLAAGGEDGMVRIWRYT